MRALVVLAIVLSAGTARADDDKSTGVALVLAVGTPLAGMVLGGFSDGSTPLEGVSLGLIVAGPSAGHIYAGEYGRAGIHTGIRAVALVGFVLAAKKWTKVSDRESEDYSSSTTSSMEVGMALGGLLFVAHPLNDWYDSPAAARRANARVTVVPTGTGIAIAGSF